MSRNQMIFLLILFFTVPLFSAGLDYQIFSQSEGNSSLEITKEDDSSIRISLETSEMIPENVRMNEIEYNNFSLEGEISTIKKGFPQLPLISRIVIVPPQKSVQLQIINIESRIEIGLNPTIFPGSEVGDAKTELTAFPDYLETEGFWPPQAVQISDPQIMRGYRLVNITMYPVQHNPNTNETRFNDNFDFELVYGDYEPINPVIDPDRIKPSTTILKTLDIIAVNPPSRDNATPERGSYLMVYPNVDGVEEAIQPLLEWRARSGWEVHAVEVQNRASTGTVKRVIQDAYDDWDNPPEMVCLIGDADGSIALSAYNQTDFDYVLLDGGDILADADLGRISVESVNRLESVVEKLVNYEADPFMDDTEWYRQGMVCAGYEFSGLSTILVNKWVRGELLNGFCDDVHGWYYNDRFENQDVPTFFRNEFRRGISYSNYRGWIGIEGLQPNTVLNFQAHRRYPIVILLTCQSGKYINVFGWTEAFLRSPGGGNGAVGLCTSQTHVQFNNALSTGCWVALLKEATYCFGSIVTRAKIELWRQYNGFDNGSVANFSRWCNFMGDPATHIFTDIPDLSSAEHPEFFALGNDRFSLNFAIEGEEVTPEGATVCLYKADDEFQMIEMTDADGNVTFNIPPDAITEGDLMVTVTKHNTIPYLTEVEVGESEFFLSANSWVIDDDEEGESSGDNDDIANPGETIELTISMLNNGTEVPDGPHDVYIHSLSTYASVVGDTIVTIENFPAVDESVEILTVVELASYIPDGFELKVATDVLLDDDETVWESMAVLYVEAPQCVFYSIDFENESFNPGDNQHVDIAIRNTGSRTLPAFVATLQSMDNVVSVVDEVVNYSEIAAGEVLGEADSQFRIRAHPFTIPGMTADMELYIEVDNGYQDTIYFSVQIGESGDGQPFGPDEYGYVCFDSDDEGWEMTPVYDWVEIDPREDEPDFEGTDTELRDVGENQDRSTLVDLPFTFQYYGEEFSEITICTNGWVAFGNYRELSDFRNRRIASGGGPNAQLCVFWDNLMTSGNGRIFTFYDEEGDRFIVEWSNLVRQSDAGTTETFQLLLFDPEFHPTYSGDGTIVYQYKDVRNSNIAANRDTPFCTIGIGNLNDTDGLQYTYWNTYTLGATELHDELAIKFTTAVEFITGSLSGTITDARGGAPIVNAQVFTSRGFWAETNEEGEYLIDDILIGEGYIVTVSAQGYNDSTLAGEDGQGYTIVENEITGVSTALLHPEFNIDRDNFRYILNAQDTISANVVLSNDGNGTLEFISRFGELIEGNEEGGPSRDDTDDIWNPRLIWTAGDSVDDTKLAGIEFINDHWLVSGGGSEPEETWFYTFDKEGNFIERFAQPVGESRYGIRDLCYFQGYLYGVFLDSNKVIKMNPETGEEINSWMTPGRLRSPVALTIDPEGYFWLSAVTNDIYKAELVGDSVLTVVETFRTRDPRIEDQNIYKYGLTWFRDDPDGYNLYIMSNQRPLPEDDPDNLLPDVSLFKMNPTNGDIMFLTNFPSLPEDARGRAAMCITPKWDNMLWVMGCVFDRTDGDLVGIMELAPNSSWIDYNPRSDTLIAAETIDISIFIETADLDTGDYGIQIEFEHNAGEGFTYIPLELIITTSSVETNSTVPTEYSLTQNFPNPFNPSTSIFYTVKKPGLTSISIFDITGRKVTDLVNQHMNTGNYRITYDAADLPAGLYLYQMKSGNFTAVKKMLLVK